MRVAHFPEQVRNGVPRELRDLDFLWQAGATKGFPETCSLRSARKTLQVDQIGRFASQTYGGGLRFQFTARQDITGYAAYQKRTQDRNDTSFGLSYGIHF